MNPHLKQSKASLASASTVAIVVATIAVLPLFLVGALSVQLSSDLAISPSALGTTSAAFFTAGALASPFIGPITSSFGIYNVMRSATILVSLVLVLIGTTVNSLPSLIALLAIAGAANALGQLAVNIYVSQKTLPHQQGTAYGIKQSAIPVAGLFAGLAVPLLGVTIGWRYTFVVFAITVAALVLFTPSKAGIPQANEKRLLDGYRMPKKTLRIVAFGAGLGAASGSCLTIFLVPSAVAAGFSEHIAGLIFAGACAVGIISRLFSGIRADIRGTKHFEAVAMMLSLGSIGFLALATESPLLFPFGAAVAFGLGWGWPGLLIFSTIQRSSAYPAEGTAYIQIGSSIGCVVGPLLFGILADHFSYSVAWIYTTINLVAAAACLAAVRSPSNFYKSANTS